MLKNIYTFFRFWFWLIPFVWIPKRLSWRRKRKKCKKNGCDLDRILDEKSKRVIYTICLRCGAYEGRYGDNSDYNIVRDSQ